MITNVMNSNRMYTATFSAKVNSSYHHKEGDAAEAAETALNKHTKTYVAIIHDTNQKKYRVIAANTDALQSYTDILSIAEGNGYEIKIVGEE